MKVQEDKGRYLYYVEKIKKNAVNAKVFVSVTILYYFAGLSEDVETEEAMEKTEVIPLVEECFEILFCLNMH